ncbi:hypothetical protein HN415_07380 [Candidatus Woesearchaeota archaeon]|jgi:hypothetical protein|nr:hypothetical protein [Candidatus Woesearchaeota archaeon]
MAINKKLEAEIKKEGLYLDSNAEKSVIKQEQTYGLANIKIIGNYNPILEGKNTPQFAQGVEANVEHFKDLYQKKFEYKIKK